MTQPPPAPAGAAIPFSRLQAQAHVTADEAAQLRAWLARALPGDVHAATCLVCPPAADALIALAGCNTIIAEALGGPGSEDSRAALELRLAAGHAVRACVRAREPETRRSRLARMITRRRGAAPPPGLSGQLDDLAEQAARVLDAAVALQRLLPAYLAHPDGPEDPARASAALLPVIAGTADSLGSCFTSADAAHAAVPSGTARYSVAAEFSAAARITLGAGARMRGAWSRAGAPGGGNVPPQPGDPPSQPARSRDARPASSAAAAWQGRGVRPGAAPRLPDRSARHAQPSSLPPPHRPAGPGRPSPRRPQF